jgi:hypothetical protein
MKLILFVFLFASPLFTFSQIDSIKDKLVSVREQLIFLDSTIQNKMLFGTEGDYGHSGFISSEFTISHFNDWWYSTYWTHYLNYKKSYDENNKLTEEIWFHKNGDTLTSFQYAYDTSNNITERREILNDKIRRITNTRYYNNAKPSASVTVNLLYFGSFEYKYFTYNKEGLLLKENRYDEEGYTGGTEYEYDESGRKLKWFSKSSWVTVKIDEKQSSSHRTDTGTKKLAQQYLYDSSNNVSAIQYYSFNRNNNTSYLDRTVNFSYDVKGRKVSEYYNNKSNYHIEYKYFDNDLIKSVQYISNVDTAQHLTLTTNRKIEYFYDKNKKPEKLIYQDDFKIWIVKFKYKFDSHNNWIEQTKIVDDKPLYIRKREIVYRSK